MKGKSNSNSSSMFGLLLTKVTAFLHIGFSGKKPVIPLDGLDPQSSSTSPSSSRRESVSSTPIELEELEEEAEEKKPEKPVLDPDTKSHLLLGIKRIEELLTKDGTDRLTLKIGGASEARIAGDGITLQQYFGGKAQQCRGMKELQNLGDAYSEAAKIVEGIATQTGETHRFNDGSIKQCLSLLASSIDPEIKPSTSLEGVSYSCINRLGVQGVQSTMV
jgi:hypothetical protein